MYLDGWEYWSLEEKTNKVLLGMMYPLELQAKHLAKTSEVYTEEELYNTAILTILSCVKDKSHLTAPPKEEYFLKSILMNMRKLISEKTSLTKHTQWGLRD